MSCIGVCFIFERLAMVDCQWRLFICLIVCLFAVVFCVTDPNDLKILNDFREGLENPGLLKWPVKDDDPCGRPPWPHVFCSGNRVTQIQVQGVGLKGPLPENFNQLSKLYNLGLQRNQFNGRLPSFSGLSELEFAYLDYNEFDAIPSDFFDGLSSLRVMALDHNPLNATAGWSLPDDLAKSNQLTNLSLVNCNLVGPLPEFLGSLQSLTALKLSYNRLSGQMPASIEQSPLQILWLNDQDGGGLTGPINVIGSMTMLRQVWLHGNQFTGTIPENIGDLLSLKDLNLNQNELVGLIPASLANLEMDNLVLSNNKLMGPIPMFKAANVSYEFNSFCQDSPGLQCSSEVTALLDFLGNFNYPLRLSSEWVGNNPCEGPWLGLSCNLGSKVSVINLPNRGLNGTLSPSIAKLDSLIEIRLSENGINGTVPKNLTELKSLRLLDLAGNDLEPPLPEFHAGVKLVISGNPRLANWSALPPSPAGTPPPSPAGTPPPKGAKSTPISSPSSNANENPVSTEKSHLKSSRNTIIVFVVSGILVVLVVALLWIFLRKCCRRNRKESMKEPDSVIGHPKDLFGSKNMVKIGVSNQTIGNSSTQTATSPASYFSERTEMSKLFEDGTLVISVQVLREATDDFSDKNEVGRGGFGTVYKGKLKDGTRIAVKRMEAGSISSKAQEEFRAEIAVLSMVRHRHLVSLLGYSGEGSERLLVYEYMSQGALSRHLFHWKNLGLEPLSWRQRLSIALDVARGIEYLHSLAGQTFIHRDLKSSNILLDDDFRAKVSDFGLVKLAPDGDKSVATKLAGTFGYLAPEYAVMGKITTKADVFSFGVVLMELLTGMMALDEARSEESRYLAEWFWRIKSSEQRLIAAIDPTLEAEKESFETISVMAELAGHCTSREPNHRPDMGHVVSVLAPLVEKWKPIDDESDGLGGIDYNLPLPLMLLNWQETESRVESCSTSFADSKGSIPARPVGFAESFTSVDGR